MKTLLFTTVPRDVRPVTCRVTIWSSARGSVTVPWRTVPEMGALRSSFPPVP